MLLLILKYSGGLIAVIYGVYATLTDFRDERDGRKVLSKKGYIGITLLLTGSLLALSVTGLTDYVDHQKAIKERDEKIEAAKQEQKRQEDARTAERELQAKLELQLRKSEAISSDLKAALNNLGVQLKLSEATSERMQSTSKVIDESWIASSKLHNIKLKCTFDSYIPLKEFGYKSALYLSLDIGHQFRGGNLSVIAHADDGKDSTLVGEIHAGGRRQAMFIPQPQPEAEGWPPFHSDESDWDPSDPSTYTAFEVLFSDYVWLPLSEGTEYAAIVVPYRPFGFAKKSYDGLYTTLEVNIAPAKIRDRARIGTSTDTEWLASFDNIGDLRGYVVSLRAFGTRSKNIKKAVLQINNEFEVEIPLSEDQRSVKGRIGDILQNIKRTSPANGAS